MTSEFEELSEKQVLFEDEQVVVAVKDTAFTPGQIIIFPKKRDVILESVPDDTLKHCFRLARKVAIATFDSLKAEGTNILIKNGLPAGQTVPHFGIDVIPRRAEDGLPFMLQGEKEKEEELLMVQEQLNNAQKIVERPKVPNEENVLLQSLRRMP